MLRRMEVCYEGRAGLAVRRRPWTSSAGCQQRGALRGRQLGGPVPLEHLEPMAQDAATGISAAPGAGGKVTVRANAAAPHHGDVGPAGTLQDGHRRGPSSS